MNISPHRTSISPIRLARGRAGLSMRELAVRSGISYEHIRLLETGERGKNPSLWIARKIAAGLGVSLDEIWPPS